MIVSLKNTPQQTFRFEVAVYNDEKMIITLFDLKNEDTKYEEEYSYDNILKVFNVLPNSEKNELCNLTNFQVFIVGLVKHKKLEIYPSRNNSLRLEFLDVAQAPKGAVYNVTVHIPKA